MGTSGVGPFIEDSNKRFCEFWRSVNKCGPMISRNRETISSLL
jgi:hypothetical protein